MARNGRRHRLVLYTYVLNRLWKYTLGIGIAVLALTAALALLPIQLPQYHILWVSDWILRVAAGAGVYAVMLSLLFIGISKLAYVQPSANNLRLITPFLRVWISYRRILKSFQCGSAAFVPLRPLPRLATKFPAVSGERYRHRAGPARLAAPAPGAEVVPGPLLLSGQVPRLALLVPKWMDFSMDLENFRSIWLESQQLSRKTPQSDLLASISRHTK